MTATSSSSKTIIYGSTLTPFKPQLLAGDDSFCVKRFVHKGFRVTGYRRIHPDIGLDLVRKHLNSPTWECKQVLDEAEAAEDSE